MLDKQLVELVTDRTNGLQNMQFIGQMVNFEFQTMNVDITSDCLYGLFRLLNFLIGLYIIIQET